MVLATKAVDRRTERTRLALQSAFIELLLAQGYEALTPAEISRKANVGRSTFYLHYAGKQELLKESMKIPSSAIAACVDASVTSQQVRGWLDHFREQRAANRMFFTYPLRAIWVQCLAELIELRLPREPRQSGVRPIIPRSLIALSVAEMQIALISQWLNATRSVRSENVADALMASTRALVVGFLEARADRRPAP
jgi:AcrR family transcriptional regulator